MQLPAENEVTICRTQRQIFPKPYIQDTQNVKHPALGPTTSVLVAGVQQRNVALVTHMASGPF